MNDHNHQPGQGHGSLHPHGIEEPPVSSVRGIPLVELVEVSSSYGTTPALQNVSLKIWPGQFIAIVGPNGGGKTTLLRTILGMIPATQGKVLLRGQELNRSSMERMGYVPQLETIDWNFPITAEEVIHFLHEINHHGVAIVITAHDLNWVAAHLPWAVCLNRRLIAQGRPQEIFNAAVLKDTYSGEMIVFHHDGMVMIGERPHAP